MHAGPQKFVVGIADFRRRGAENPGVRAIHLFAIVARACDPLAGVPLVGCTDRQIWCFAEKWSMHVCECKRLPRWTDVRISIRSSLTWLQGTDCAPSAIAPGITGESHSHPLARGKTWD